MSTKKGEAKRPLPEGEEAVLREDWGIEGDVHAGPGIKQVSLLAWESVEKQVELMRRAGVECPKAKELVGEKDKRGAAKDTERKGEKSGAESPTRQSRFGDGAPHTQDSEYELHPGDYAENLTVQGVALSDIRPGDRIAVGSNVVLKVTRIGKECHKHCAVYARLGDCVMPREGVFTRVVAGGRVAPGDEVVVRTSR